MKKIILLSFFICNTSFANLYLTTEYQEGKRPKVTTKQHIFLDKRYTINYTKRSYVLILKKIVKDHVTIESERYAIDQFGHKTMEGGSYGDYRVGSSFTINDKGGGQRFTLKITLDKLVPSIP